MWFRCLSSRVDQLYFANCQTTAPLAYNLRQINKVIERRETAARTRLVDFHNYKVVNTDLSIIFILFFNSVQQKPDHCWYFVIIPYY